jgi:hypothetical protein
LKVHSYVYPHNIKHAVRHAVNQLFDVFVPFQGWRSERQGGLMASPIEIDYVLQSSLVPVKVAVVNRPWQYVENIRDGNHYYRLLVDYQTHLFLIMNNGFYLVYVVDETELVDDEPTVTYYHGEWIRLYPCHAMTYDEALIDANSVHDPLSTMDEHRLVSYQDLFVGFAERDRTPRFDPRDERFVAYRGDEERIAYI